MAPYTATKAAVGALTESLHSELAIMKAPIRTSLLAPGPVRSGIFNDPFSEHVRTETRDFVEVVRQLLTQHGLDADSFADRVFAAIDQGLFWILPQPATIDAQLRHRVDAILARRDPELPTILGGQPRAG